MEVIADEGISGELVSRPGIDRVHAGVCDDGWHLVLCEDSSRLYRHETACAELIETAVDEDIRVICISIDLFHPPAHVRWLQPCLALRREDPRRTLRAIAAELQINYMTAKRALD